MNFYGSSDNSKIAIPMWTSEGVHNLPLDKVQITADGPITTPFERKFNPYDFNGGTTVCIAGEDFAIAAGCTRMSTGYQILSRTQSKLNNLSDKTVLASAGCMSDITVLNKTLQTRFQEYEQKSAKTMSTASAAQLLSVTLYYRRFFPYYAFCMLAGLDENGKGAVYGYDAVGSYKRDTYGAMGSGQNLVIPLIDNLVGHQNRLDEKKPLTIEETVAIIKTAFIVATERDIHTGDSVEIKIITKDGIKTEIFDLKKD